MKRLIKVCLPFLFILLAACSAAPRQELAPVRGELFACPFQRERFEGLIAGAEPLDADAELSAAIVPHYAPALDLACDILSGVSRAISTVVIVAPNHPGTGEALTVSSSDWYWEGGRAVGNKALAQELCEGTGGVVSFALDADEWSASTLIPYAAHYFPGADFVAVYLSRGAEVSALDALAERLAEKSEDGGLLVLGSADFSHYQDEPTARENDNITTSLIESGDTTALLRLGNAYIDSPETAAVIIKYAAALSQTLTKRDSVLTPYIENGRRLAGSFMSFAAAPRP